MTVLDVNQIKELLPHRYPFLMIDKVIKFEKGDSLIAVKSVTVNEPFFTGHFPDYPVMPGVMITEALAQASGILVKLSFPDNVTAGDLFLLAGIDKVRFKRMVVPGDQLELDVSFLKIKQEVAKFQGIARVAGEVVCSAELMTAKKR